MDEFERTVLAKFPDFPRYDPEHPNIVAEWFAAYQRLVEYLDARRRESEATPV